MVKNVEPVKRLLAESTYLLTGFPIALASFNWLIVQLCLSASLLVVWIGVPLAILTLVVARAFAGVERVRIRLLGHDMPPASYPAIDAGWRSWLGTLRDPQNWLDVVHGILLLPLATFTWSVAVVWWAGAFIGLTFGFWQMWHGPTNNSLYRPF
jgi:hypothetical protein